MSAPRTRPNRQFTRSQIEAVAHKHTVRELAEMEWTTYTGDKTRIHPKTISNWLRASGISAKQTGRLHELSEASKAEMRGLHEEGVPLHELTLRSWTDKGGTVRKFNRTTIYDTCVRRHNRRTYLNTSMSDASFTAMMLGFPLE